MPKKFNLTKYEKVYTDKNYNGIIELGIDEIEDLYSPFSLKTNKKIDYNIYQHINDISNCIPMTSKNISLDIYIDKTPSDDEKIEAESTLRKYFAEEIIEKKIYIQKLFLIALLLFGIGLSFIVISTIFSFNKIIETIIEIASWVFIWETIDIIFFHCSLELFKYNRIKRLFNSTINFKKYLQQDKIKKH